MEGRLLDKIAEPFNVQAFERNSFEEQITDVLRVIGSNSRGLSDVDKFLDRNLLQLTDGLNEDTLLWIFRGGPEGGSIMKTHNERVGGGSWEVIEGTQKVVISAGAGQIMYTLAFLDNQFFILQRYGTARNSEVDRYLVFADERLARSMEATDAIEYLYNKYRNQSRTFIIFFGLILLAFLLFIALSR